MKLRAASRPSVWPGALRLDKPEEASAVGTRGRKPRLYRAGNDEASRVEDHQNTGMITTGTDGSEERDHAFRQLETEKARGKPASSLLIESSKMPSALRHSRRAHEAGRSSCCSHVHTRFATESSKVSRSALLSCKHRTSVAQSQHGRTGCTLQKAGKSTEQDAARTECRR